MCVQYKHGSEGRFTCELSLDISHSREINYREITGIIMVKW